MWAWQPVVSGLSGTVLSAGTPVLTFSAPTATRVAGGVSLVAGTPTLSFSAPSATLATGGGPQTLVAGTPVLTFSAPTATRLATITFGLGTPILTFSAHATLTPGNVSLLVGTPVMVFSGGASLAISGGGLTDYVTSYHDMNVAMRSYLNDYYTTTNMDIAPILARWLAEHTAQDSTRAWAKLYRRCRGDST